MFVEIVVIALIAIFAVYAGIMLIIGTGWYKINYFEISGNYHPVTRISVIIPVRDEEDNILNILRDIAGQDFPEDKLEVIIVNDFSTDKTGELARQYISSLFHNKHYSIIDLNGDPSEGSKKKAITEGIRQANGTLIVTTDADCCMDKDWLKSIAGYYEKYHPRMITGPVRYDTGKAFFGQFQSMEFLGLIGAGAGATGAGRPVMCNGANLAYEKEAFMTVNGFDGNFKYASGDDVFLLHKIRKHYGSRAVRFLKSRKSIVHTKSAKSLKEFFYQRVRWGSKAKAYRDGFSLLTAISVFLLNTGLLAGLLTGLFIPVVLKVSLVLLLLKMLADLPVMTGISRFMQQQKMMLFYPILEIMYLVYIPVAAFLGAITKYRWKGRRG